MARCAPPLLLALAVLLVGALAADAAKPKHPCAQGTVRVAKSPCVRVPQARALPSGAAARIARIQALVDALPLRTKAHRRLRKRTRAARRAMPRLLAPRAVLARASAGSWEPIEPPKGVDRARRRVEEIAPPDGQDGGTAKATVEAEENGVTLTQGMTLGGSMTGCPDAGGVVNGTADWALEQGTAKGGDRFGYEMKLHMDWTAQVGDDARIQRYRYRTAIDVETRARTRGRHVPTRRYRVILDRAGLDPRKPRDHVRALADPGYLEGTYLGPKGRRDPIGREMAVTLVGAAVMAQQLLEDQANERMLGGEKLWYDHYLCVDVVPDPAERRVSPGSVTEVKWAAIAKDGGPVTGAAVVDAAWGGSAAPQAGTVAPGAPFAVSFTKDDENDGGLRVLVTSRRGRGVDTVALPKLQAAVWDFRYQATGTYAREEAQQGFYTRREEATATWDVSWTGAPLGSGTGWSDVAPAALRGTGTDSGTWLGAPFTCSGALASPNGNGLIVARSENGVYYVRLSPFERLDRDPLMCGGAALPWHPPRNVPSAADGAGPFDAVVRLTPEDLARDGVVVEQVRGPVDQYDPGCADDGPATPGLTCDQVAGITGTVTIARRELR
jgi:hypothetical protein